MTVNDFAYCPKSETIPYGFAAFERVEESLSKYMRYAFSVIGDSNDRIRNSASQREHKDSLNVEDDLQGILSPRCVT